MRSMTSVRGVALVVGVALLSACWPCKDCPPCPPPPPCPPARVASGGDQGMIKIKVTPGGISTIDYLNTSNASAATGPGGIISEEYALGTGAGNPWLDAGTSTGGACNITKRKPLIVAYTLAANGTLPPRRVMLKRTDENSQRLDWYVNGIRIQTLCRGSAECQAGSIPADLTGAITGSLRACDNEADCNGNDPQFSFDCATINP